MIKNQIVDVVKTLKKTELVFEDGNTLTVGIANIEIEQLAGGDELIFIYPAIKEAQFRVLYSSATLNKQGTSNATELREFWESNNFFFDIGSQVIADGRVEFRADLPITLIFPPVGAVYFVEKPTLILGLWKQYPSGSYIKDTDTGSLSDWRKINDKNRFTTNEFRVFDAGDQTKQLAFDNSNILTSTLRTVTWPDKNGTVALTSDFLGALNTGILTGGNVTINGGDNTKFDVAAGTGIIVDFTNQSSPKQTKVSWNAFTAESVILTNLFTSLAIDVDGLLVKSSGVPFTNAQTRQLIALQAVTHESGVQIDNISNNSRPAYEAIAAILDYINALGAVNRSNDYSANGTNLQIDKSPGETILPFINRAIDQQNPAQEINAAIVVASLVYTHRDGVGGFVFLVPSNDIDPDNFDDGSGTLVTVSPNKFTIQRFNFFGQVNRTAVSYGQVEYNSIAEAEAAVMLENPILSPLLLNAVFTTALIVKEGTTDLTNVANAKFICIGTR